MPGAQEGEDGIVARFLRTPEGIALNTAFDRIADPRIRRCVIDLAETLASKASVITSHRNEANGTSCPPPRRCPGADPSR